VVRRVQLRQADEENLHHRRAEEIAISSDIGMAETPMLFELPKVIDIHQLAFCDGRILL
jgi:hypothetical protein